MFRRQFLKTTAASVAASTALPDFSFADHHKGHAPFKISLAEWSLHRTLRDKSKNLTRSIIMRFCLDDFWWCEICVRWTVCIGNTADPEACKEDGHGADDDRQVGVEWIAKHFWQDLIVGR